MKEQFLKKFIKEQIGQEVVWGYFSYQLHKLGFEDIFDSYDEGTLKDILESGVCYYAFLKDIGINEENEELDGLNLRLEFEVIYFSEIDENISSTVIKIKSFNIDRF